MACFISQIEKKPFYYRFNDDKISICFANYSWQIFMALELWSVEVICDAVKRCWVEERSRIETNCFKMK